MIISSNPPPDNVAVNFQQVEHDVKALYKAGQGKIGTDEVNSILLNEKITSTNLIGRSHSVILSSIARNPI